MKRVFPIQLQAKGAVLSTVALLCLWNAPVSAYEQSEKDVAAAVAGDPLSSSGLATLASIQSAVQEVASMKWNGSSNVAVAEPTPAEQASAAAALAAAAKKDSDSSTDSGGPKNSFLPPGALNVSRASDTAAATVADASAKDTGAATTPAQTPTSSSTTASSTSASKGLSLAMPASEADKLRRLSDRINGSMGTMVAAVKDSQDRKKDAFNKTGQDKKNNDGGTPLDRDASSKSRFGAKGESSLNTIDKERKDDDDPFAEFLKDQKKKQQAGKEKEKTKEEKEKEEKERKELEQQIGELANKPPPFTLQDYYDFRDLIAKKNKALGDVSESQPEFAKKAQTIFDEFSSRDGDESKKNAFRDFVEESRDKELFQNPIIIDPILDNHGSGIVHTTPR